MFDQGKLGRTAGVAFALVLLAGCDGGTDDRFSELTGARMPVERMVMCQKTYDWRRTNFRIMRMKTEIKDVRDFAIQAAEEASETYGLYYYLLEEQDSALVAKAEMLYRKSFIDEEFSELVEQYESLLVAHCEDDFGVVRKVDGKYQLVKSE